MRHATPAKILVVDDHPQNVEVLRRLVTRFGHQALTAFDGASALESVARDLPDLGLLDGRIDWPANRFLSSRGSSASWTSTMP